MKEFLVGSWDVYHRFGGKWLHISCSVDIRLVDIGEGTFQRSINYSWSNHKTNKGNRNNKIK